MAINIERKMSGILNFFGWTGSNKHFKNKLGVEKAKLIHLSKPSSIFVDKFEKVYAKQKAEIMHCTLSLLYLFFYF